MGDWEEAFDSPLLWGLTSLSTASWFAVFIFGGKASANLNYLLLLMVGIVASFATYLQLGGLPDRSESVDGQKIATGFLIGISGVVLVSIVFSSLTRTLQAGIWVPEQILLFQVNGGSAGTEQYLLDIAVLMFLVGPAERGLVATGGLLTFYTGIGEDLPLYAQPGFVLMNGLWAAMHVVFGQYNILFFPVAFISGEIMLFAADVTGDWVSSVLTHSVIDVAFRTIGFLQTGGLQVSFN